MNGTTPLWRRLLWRRLRILLGLAAVLALAFGSVWLLAPQWLLDGWQAWQARQAGLTTEAADIDGQHWAWFAGGQGPVIVLVHGFGGSRHDWVPVAAELTDNFRVLIPDLPGWGASLPVPAGDPGPRAQAARLDGFLRHAAPGGAVLIGHSAGGLIAGLEAQAHPARVHALGFVASAGAGGVIAPPGLAAYTDRAGLQRALDTAFSMPPRLPGRLLDVLARRNAARSDWVRAGMRAMRASERALVPVLPALTQPALVLWCRDDRVIAASAADTLRNELHASARIDVTTLFGCGHMPMLEQPEAVAATITRFMLPLPAPS